MGWSMGWDAKDDGRTLRPVREDEYEYVGGISEMPALVPPSDSRQVVLYHAQGFNPDTVYIRPNQVQVTEWESIYSSAFRLGLVPFSEATFAPIVDNSLTVVGHIGWADGTNIIVPEYTIRNRRHFWSILQKVRLDEERQRLLDEDARWDRARPFPDSPLGRPTTSAPKDPRRWSGPDVCVPRRHTMSLDTRQDQARRGPLKDRSTEDTYGIDLDLFVTGGGKAFVGRHFFDRGDALYLPSVPGVPDGRLGSPKTLYSSGVEFLLLVDPEGHIQRVMDVRKSIVSHGDLVIPMIELALDLTMFLDIVPIAVVLLAAGVRLALRVMIRAIVKIIEPLSKELIENAFERAALELAAESGTGLKEVAKSAEEAAALAERDTIALKEIPIDPATRARYEARGARLHLDQPGSETVGKGEFWRDGAATPEPYWAKSGAKAEKQTLPKTPEQIAEEAEAAEYKRLKREGKTPKKKKVDPTEAKKPEEFKPSTYVTKPKPIEGPNKGIPEHMPDASPAEKQKWLQSDQGAEYLNSQRLDGPDAPHPYTRSHEAEKHMFDRLEKMTTDKTKGEFHFMMDHPTCPACKNLQFQFTKTREGIKLVQHEPDFLLKPKPPSAP
jgi:hypothetical protein